MGLLDAAMDSEFRQDVARGLLDVGNRGIVAGLLGAPVDMATMVMRPFGYSDEAPVGGSEWIGRGMENLGLVSSERRPVAEGLASMVGPGAGVKLARGLSKVADLSPSMAASGDGFDSLVSQLGVISREGKARLQADLRAGKSSGTYLLGDISESQLNGLVDVGLTPAKSRDVMMTPGAFWHIYKKRLLKEKFTPEEIAKFAEEAMAKRSYGTRDPSKANQEPSLFNSGLRDSVTGRAYAAQMPLYSDGDTLQAISIIPKGLPPRKVKKMSP